MTDLLERLRAALSPDYRVERELGGGGMSRVFLAEEMELGRRVVIKVLPPEMAAGVSIDRFRREIQLAAALQHPHIVPLLHAGHVGEVLYYTMPLIEGESLRAKLAREGALPIADSVRILRDVVDALAYAHRYGVAHRDIKPDNVLISAHHAVVTDFGVAKALGEATGETSLTSVGVTLGTPAYMAPEQAAADPHVDHRCDIYAVGTLAYEMLTGRPPFAGGTAQQVLAAQVSEAPPPLSKYRTTVPPALAETVMRCLEKNPADRWQSADDLLHQLEVMATPSGGTQPVPAAAARARSGRRTRLAVYAGLAALALAAVSGVVFIARGRGDAGSHQRKMLLVLPFQNLGRPDDDYFADGMTEEITARLGSVQDLGVIARTTAVQYKNTGKTIRQIGQELGVEYVLEGTVRWERSPTGSSRVRVSPQLIRVSDATHLWAHVYDEVLAGVFEVQSGIAQQVITALDVALVEPERQALVAKPTNNVAAYDAYLRGNEYYSRGYEEKGFRIAVEMYQEAVRLDRGFAQAYAQLSIVHSAMFWFYFDRTDGRVAQAASAAAKALQLRPNLPEAHLAMGYYHYWGHLDYDRALQEFAMVQARQPNNSDVLSAMAFVQRRQGKWAEALANLRKAIELDPRSQTLAFEAGLTCHLTRRYSEAERHFDRAIELAPEWSEPYSDRARLYLSWEGNTEKAERSLLPSLGKTERLALAGRTQRLGEFFVPRDEAYQAALRGLSLSSAGSDTAGYFLFKAEFYRQSHQPQFERAYSDSARVVLEAAVKQRPEDAGFHGALGLAYAGLDRKGDAIREARRSLELVPISKDAFFGAARAVNLAHVYALVGEHEAAIDQLKLLLSIPSEISIPLLRVDPNWDSLRGDPRFQRLLAGTP